ncbi:MAG: hypothetical protein GXP63_05820 [DPANN group archaeon]|nr:hypothetical protein [DPANN group archaeon]
MNRQMSLKTCTVLFSMVLFTVLLLLPAVFASDIALSLDQKEYYFRTGEQAVIPLHANNTYDLAVNGILGTTLTQQVHSGNFQYSSSNSQSASFSVAPGISETSISFGSSDTPMTLLVTMKFSYVQNGSREVVLDGLKIHFVADEADKKNQQDKMSSSSQKTRPPSSSDPFRQQQQQMQQMMNQAFNRQQQQQNNRQNSPSNTQQKLENHQLSQDSSALKQQMQRQVKQQQATRQAFQKQLAKNQDFQKAHQDLLDQGYNLTSADLDPSSNRTGSFDMHYQNRQGQQASLRGKLEDGKMTALQKDTPETRKMMMDRLQKNQDFQRYQRQLRQEGYHQNNTRFTQSMNTTTVQVQYAGPKNESATIRAQLSQSSVEKVELLRQTEDKPSSFNLWSFLLLLLLLGLVGYLLHARLFRRPLQQPEVHPAPAKKIDHQKVALAMLKQAERLYAAGKQKDAYGRAGQALRLFQSHELGLEKELTNDDIIDHLQARKKPSKDTKACFDLSSLVEFARYRPNKKDFDRIISLSETIITSKQVITSRHLKNTKTAESHIDRKLA